MRILVLAALATVVPHVAAADGTAETQAEALFREGRDLMKAESYQAACEKFAASEKLDPQPGTRFNIGLCSEKLGKLATASSIFSALAKEDPFEPRRAKAVQWVTDLGPRIPRIVITVSPPGLPGLAIKLDGVDVTSTAAAGIAVDLGSHVIDITAQGDYPPVHETRDIRDEGKVTTVRLALSGPTPVPSIKPAVEPPPPSPRKKIGIVLTVSGGAVLGGAVVASLLARSKWNDAKDACGGATCDTVAQHEKANDLTDQARTRATAATIMYVVGGLAAAGGLILWATAPSATDGHVAAGASTSSVELTYSARF